VIRKAFGGEKEALEVSLHSQKMLEKNLKLLHVNAESQTLPSFLILSRFLPRKCLAAQSGHNHFVDQLHIAVHHSPLILLTFLQC